MIHIDRFAALVGETPSDPPGIRTVVTNNHADIQRWAARHKAEPATGEVTTSGRAVRDINDGGEAIRFNFPGYAPLRPITWDEWFDYFDGRNLVFLHEEDDPDQIAKYAHAIWEARGGDGNSQSDDWLQAERELHRRAGHHSPLRYWLMKNPKASDSGAVTAP